MELFQASIYKTERDFEMIHQDSFLVVWELKRFVAPQLDN